MLGARRRAASPATEMVGKSICGSGATGSFDERDHAGQRDRRWSAAWWRPGAQIKGADEVHRVSSCASRAGVGAAAIEPRARGVASESNAR